MRIRYHLVALSQILPPVLMEEERVKYKSTARLFFVGIVFMLWFSLCVSGKLL